MPISERLYSILYKLKATSSSEHVFCDKLNNRPFGSIKRAFKTACERAKIKGIRFHDLRHTFASRLRAKGVDLVTIKELLGHADIRTTMRYAHTNMDAKKAAILALTGHKLVTEAEFGGLAPHGNSGIDTMSTIS